MLTFFNRLSWRLVIFTSVIVVLVAVVTAVSIVSGFQEIEKNAIQQSTEVIENQARNALLDVAQREARIINDQLQQAARATRNAAEFMLATARLGGGIAWDVENDLLRRANGEYMDPDPNRSTEVFVPNTVSELDTTTLRDLRESAALDALFPTIMANNPAGLAVYFINPRGAIRYYPIIELADVVPPDFDAAEGQWYVVSEPANNPERATRWTEAYVDPAGQGLMVSTSSPLYERDEFRGVIGFDVSLTDIIDNLETIRPTPGSFAMLIDENGQLIAAPERALSILTGRTDASGAGTLINALGFDLNQAPGNALAPVLSELQSGQPGLAAVDFSEAASIVSYAPLPDIGWHLAVAAPVAEITAQVSTLQNTLTQNITSALRSTLFALSVIIVIAFASMLIFGRRLSRQIETSAAATQAIASGDYSVTVPVTSTDELGILASGLNDMSSRIRDLVGSLEERVSERTRDLQTVADVNRQISTILNVDRLLQDVVDLTKERFRLYHAHIYILNEAGDTLVLTAGAGHVGRQMVSEHRIIAMNNPNSIVARAANTRKSVIVNDVTQSPTFLPHPLLPDTRSELAVPLVARGQLLGVLDVQNNTVEYFGDDARSVLELLAGQIATALSNAALFEAADRASRHERALGAISRTVQSATGVDEILQVTVRELGKALRVPHTAIELELPSNKPSDE